MFPYSTYACSTNCHFSPPPPPPSISFPPGCRSLFLRAKFTFSYRARAGWARLANPPMTSFPLFHELPRTAGSKKWHSINDGLRGVIRNCTKSDKSAPAQQSPAISSTISCEQEGKVLDHANIRESLFNQIFI